jgi:long-chain acyl-CoA synthetase
MLKRNIFKKITRQNNNSKLYFNDKIYSFKDEIKKINFFDRQEFKKRRLILFLCQNDPYIIILFSLCITNKHVPILIDKDVDDSALSEIISKYDPDFIITKKKFYSINFEKYFDSDNFSVFKSLFNKQKKFHEDLALLLPTSGTTGSPKLVRISHINLLSNTQDISDYLNIKKDDVTITTMPFNYTYGMSIVITHLFKDASIVVYDGTILEKRFFELINKFKVSNFGGVPIMYEMLKKIKFENISLRSLKYLTQAGGKLSDQLWDYLYQMAKKKNIEFFTMYGATEATSRMSFLPFDMMMKKKGSIGKGLATSRLSIIDNKTSKIIDKSFKKGEILYEGKNVFMGYAYNYNDLSKHDLIKGKLFTNDLGHKDQDGYFYIDGRKDRYVKIYGHRVNLDELELILKKKYANCYVVKKEKIIIFSTENHNGSSVIDYLSNYVSITKNIFDFKYIKNLPLKNNKKIDYAKFG